MSTGSPLRGWKILVTASDGERLCSLLRAHGADPIAIPMIEIRSAAAEALDAALRGAADYAWIVVTSVNGATAVLDRMGTLGIGGSSISEGSGTRWAAVGPATRSALERGGIAVAIVPPERTGAAIPGQLGDLAGRRVLLPRSAAAGSDLPRALRRLGAAVDEVVAYETVEGPERARVPLARAIGRGLDAAVFTSGSTVRGFARLTPDPLRALADAAVIAIGPVTARAVERAGLGRALVAADRTAASLVAALEDPARA